MRGSLISSPRLQDPLGPAQWVERNPVRRCHLIGGKKRHQMQSTGMLSRAIFLVFLEHEKTQDSARILERKTVQHSIWKVTEDRSAKAKVKSDTCNPACSVPVP